MRSEAVDAPTGGAAGEHAAANAVANTSPASGVADEVATVVVASAAPASMDMSMARRGGRAGRERPDARREDALVAAAQVTQAQNEQRCQRHWRRMVHRELRDGLVNGMLEELQRITGDEADVRYLRMCASRYESFVWKKSANQVQYKDKLERRIESLRRQPSQAESGSADTSANVAAGLGLDVHVGAVTSPDSSPEAQAAAVAAGLAPCHHRNPTLAQQAGRDAACALMALPHRHASRRSGTRKASGGGNRAAKRQKRSSSVSSACSTSSVSSSTTSLAPTTRDEQYFAKLHEMKTQYRDEVALVFRELCRVNTVIQHSASLRRHESNNLGDFLVNLKKIIYLLEQQPGEMAGMIPTRKRTVAYLGVVESHIQRKVLPILHRLRHTYSTILRPIVLNYMRNSYRFSRRL